ncbi:MAG TPA: glycosyltransferase family 2 protein [Bryobacteraceae bacterium]|nr:glycosyltransferase family 2 protein [Bryobacteraceae bacterium]
MTRGCELSVVVPAFEEAECLGHALEIIAAHCRALTDDFEIVVVDDGSSDGTWAELESRAGSLRELRAVRLSRNFGKEAALFAGLAEAGGSAVVVMDADLQHPPALLGVFYRLWKSAAADVVEGVKRSRTREPLLRRLFSSVFNRLLTLLTGCDFRGNSDFNLLDRRVVDTLLRMPERRSFFRGMVGWLGFRHYRIEFDVEPRQEGISRWGTIALIRLAGRAVVSYSGVPLRLIHIAAGGFLLMASSVGARSLWLYVTGAAIGGFMTVILLLLVLGALVLLSLGVIAEYLGAIYEEAKGRPRYLISQRLCSQEFCAAGQIANLAGALDTPHSALSREQTRTP